MTDARDTGPIDALIRALAGLPGLGPRSARRAALHLLSNKTGLLEPLIATLAKAADEITTCATCGNLDFSDPCRLCTDPRRDAASLCVCAGVADLWAIERTNAFRGRYHVLGGVLSALDGVGPEDLSIPGLLDRVRAGSVREVILALSATVDGQSTAHVVTDRLQSVAPSLKISRLAHGVPVGGELDYLDEGTITTAFKSRSAL